MPATGTSSSSTRATTTSTSLWYTQQRGTSSSCNCTWRARTLAQPFPEKALDDRSTNVQSIAVSLLARIPGSALAQRMCSRADAILTHIKGKITITMPQAIDEHWKHDGLNKDDVATSAALQQIL